MSKELEWLVSQEAHAAQAAVSSTVSPTTDVVNGETKGIETESPDKIKGVDAKNESVKVTGKDIETGEPTEAETLVKPDQDVNANADKKGGTLAIGDASASLEAHPTEPVIGGKMPEESKMDENPRGTVTHVDASKEKVKVTDTQLDTPETDEANVDKGLEVGAGDKNVPTHVPGQTKEAQKQLDGNTHTEALKTASVSIEQAEQAEDGSPVVQEDNQPAAAEQTAAVGEGEEPQSQLAADISELTVDEIDPVQEATDHVNEVAGELEEINQMGVALEHYHHILSAAVERDGKIDPLLAKAVSVGLEQFGENWLSEAMPSMESFSDPTGSWTVSTEALDNIKKKSGELVQAGQAVLKKLWEWLTDLFNSVVNSTEALRTRNKEIEELVGTITKPNTQPMELKGASRLYANNLFTGDNPAAMQEIKKAGQNFLVTYPKTVEKVLSDFTAGMKRLNPLQHKAIDAQVLGEKIYSDNFKFESFGLKPVQANAIPPAFAKFNAVGRSEILPGNKAMYAGLKTATATTNDGHQMNAQTTAMFIPEVFKMGFVDVPDANAGTPDAKVKVPDANTIKVLLKGVDGLIDTLGDIKGAQTSLGQTKTKLEREAMQTYSRNQWLNSDLGATALGMSTILGRNAMAPIGNFVGYLVSIIKAYQALLKAYADHHGAKLAEAKDDSVIEGQVA